MMTSHSSVNDDQLLAYGQTELQAFRNDMKIAWKECGKDTKLVSTEVRLKLARSLRKIFANQDARRAAAGLTRAQAERAVRLAASQAAGRTTSTSAIIEEYETHHEHRPTCGG